MRQMLFNNYTQYSFWGNIEYETNRDAMLARNEHAKQLQKQGYRVVKRSLTGQMRQYYSLGVPDGRIGTVYYVDAYEVKG